MSVRAALLLLLVLGAARAQKDGYAWTSGRLAVVFPDEPQSSSQTTKDGLMKTGLLLRDRRLFMVQVVETPPAEKRTEAKALALLVKGRNLLAPKAKVVAETKDNLAGGHLGRQWLLQRPDKQYIRLRLYLVGDDLVGVLVAGPKKEDVAKDDAKAFLDSLRIDKKK
ncbi:MAG: hypothetical protein K2W96_17430 [Gemmataceae bacterium]|nr:hypothetical protein [Gemmataceae bacterium]